jgi:molecular chaperone DnaK (HSP70)
MRIVVFHKSSNIWYWCWWYFISKSSRKETGVEQSVTIQGASNLNETEVADMLAEADKYATADKKTTKYWQKSGWSIMLWSWKELGLFKDNISDQQQNITKIIEDIRKKFRTTTLKLKSQVEDLKWLWKIWLQLKLMMNQIQIQCQI